MPGTFGEALRALETLPGVIPNVGFGGGANGIIVRGANPNANTYLYDDLPILYPFHLDGLTSVIHNDLIKSIDLYSGAYPANFNNATGGIIEIETVDSVQKQKVPSKYLYGTQRLMPQHLLQVGKDIWQLREN